MDFSFTKEPGLILIKHLSSILPEGVKMHVFYISSNKSICRADYKNNQISASEITDDNQLSKIYDVREYRRNPYSWEIDQSLIEEYSTKDKNIQFKITNEDDHLILSMRFNSDYDKENDVVYVYFKPDLGFFGIEGGRISMNTENKTLIANMLYNSSAAVLQQAKEDRENLISFTDKTKSAISSVKTYKEKLKQLEQEHHNNTINIAESFISSLSKKYNVGFIFTDESIEALKDFNSNLPQLQNLVENAAMYAYNLNSHLNLKTIVIEEEYFEFSKSDTIQKAKSEVIGISSKKPSKTEKIESTLHGLERAVKVVIANKLDINGQNVGDACKPSKTAAAITIYLKKHKDVINEILIKEPTRFPELRSKFRPLQNIIPRKEKASSNL